MQYDKTIMISVGTSRKALNWVNTSMMWSEFITKLQTPVRSNETLAEYLRYPKAKQDDLKDVGGFVGGALFNGRRKTHNVITRTLITLDLDAIPSGETENVLKIVNSLGCAYAVYSTRKHEPIKPRLRIVVPANREITLDEYEPAARMLASLIGIQYADPTTFEAARLMYWPSVSVDSQYICTANDAPFIDVDALLTRYENWQDILSWPQVPGVQPVTQYALTKQGDPETKQGIVGSFCRVYDVYRAITELLPGQYVEATEGRYTFTGGSTTGGAVIYDKGKFIFSHHATDPAGGSLCNSFDLVRLHLFGEKDMEVKPGTPVVKTPSWLSMLEYVNGLPEVAGKVTAERYNKATEAFSELKTNVIPFPGKEAPIVTQIVPEHLPEADTDKWLKMLQISTTTGQPIKNAHNVSVTLAHDPLLKGRILRDAFSDLIEGIAPLPWGNRKNEDQAFAWTDEDSAGLRVYLESVLGFRTKDLIKDAFDNHVQQYCYNPVQNYLNGLQWDGNPRLDTMFIDFFGTDDDEYIRAVARKILVGGVARVMVPGTKFDYMPVIQGAQGIGKTTFCERLGLRWFTNGIKDFKDKTAAELLQGTWVVEFGELEGFSKADIKRIKGFLTQTTDHYRAAYAATTEKHPRQCIFFGTTNDYTYLSDPTGNRRFWPVDCNLKKRKLNVLKDLNSFYVDQLWAEAVARWRVGEPLFLSPELEAVAELKREPHKETDPLLGQIEEFVNTKLPIDWQKWDMGKRQTFWSGFGDEITVLTERDKVCAAEIWREMLNDRRPIPRQESTRINRCLENLEGWERIPNSLRFGKIYGTQRGFQRKKRE